jgi:hypothetical protein
LKSGASAPLFYWASPWGYASPEYAEALEHRRTALDCRLIFVEGVVVAT